MARPEATPLALAALAAALLVAGGAAFAQDEPAPEQPAPDAPAAPSDDAPAERATPSPLPLHDTPMDAGHDALERLFGKVLALDRFFGDDGLLDPLRRGSWVALRNDLRLTGAYGVQDTVSLRAKLRLPGMDKWLRDRVHVLLESASADTPDEIVPDAAPTAPVEPARLDQDASALLRYAFIEKLGFDLGASAGVMLRIPVDAVVRLRARYALDVGGVFLARIALVPFWRTDLGLGAIVSADLQRELGGSALARIGGSATANEQEESRGVQWASEVGVVQPLGPTSAYSLAYGARGVTRPVPRIEAHRAYFRVRTGFLRRWLFAELEPEAVWPMTDPEIRKPVWGFILRIEIQLQSDGGERPVLPVTPTATAPTATLPPGVTIPP